MSDIPVIAIDGPSGSGKGTIAEMVANRLGFILLDSGALYRILGIAAHKANLELDNHNQVANLARTLEIEFCNAGTVLLNGEDVSKDIRTELGSSLASQVGSIPAAREALYERQLQFRKSPGLVSQHDMVDTISQFFSWLEVRHIFTTKCNWSACLRITTNPWYAIMQRKTTKSSYFDSFSLR